MAVRAGKTVAIRKGLGDAREVVDCRGLHVLPGLKPAFESDGIWSMRTALEAIS